MEQDNRLDRGNLAFGCVSFALALPSAVLAAYSIGRGFWVATAFAILSMVILLPLHRFWRNLPDWGWAKAEPRKRWLKHLACCALIFASFVAGAIELGNTPEGKAAAERRLKERKEQAAKEDAAEQEARTKQAAIDAANKQAEDAKAQVALAQEQKAKVEKERSGLHCLSSWNGAYRPLSNAVEPTLRNPSSFEHIETRITPLDAAGNHTAIMKFRAENGFGGLNVGIATATVRGSDCGLVSWSFISN